MYKAIFLLIASVLLFFIGYNAVFNTQKTIARYVSLSNYKEGSSLYKLLTSENNVIWVKVSGVVILIFGLILLVSFFVLLNRQMK